MERGWSGLGLTLYLRSLAVLSLVTTQPCPQEPNLMRNPDCIDGDCDIDESPFDGDCDGDIQCYIAQLKLFVRNHCLCNEEFAPHANEMTSARKADCSGINNCVDKNSNELCGPNGTCHNTVASYNCSSNQAFEASGVNDSSNLSKDQHQELSLGEYSSFRERELRHSGAIPVPGNENRSAPVQGITLPPVNRDTAEPVHRTIPSVNGDTPTSAPVTSPVLPNDPVVDSVSAAGTIGIEPILATPPEQPVSPVEIFCSRMTNSSSLLGELCQKPAKGSLLQDIISLTTRLFAEESPLRAKAQEERLISASQVLQDMESAAITLALNSKGQGLQDVTNKAMDLQLRVVDVSSVDNKVSLEAKGNVINISWKPAPSSEMTGSVAVAFIVYHDMDSVLHGAPYKNKETSERYEEAQLQSRVISAAVGSSGNNKLSVAVSFSLKHKEDTSVGWKRLCAYWMHTKNGGHWSPSGCKLVGSNDTHTTCQCDHLSSFAILMAFSEELQDYSDKPLTVITFIGIPISLVCLALAIGTFVFCSQAQNAITATHTQLCISLFLAELLFIMGIDKTGNQKVCGIIAGCLHYLFLTAFAWMSLETLQLHLMVRNLKNLRVFHSSNIGRYIYPLGYGPPALIVVVSAAASPNGYGSHRHCWLLVENGFVWSFLGPVYLIILANTFLFTITLCILNEELSNRDMNVSKIKDTRMLTFKAIGQIFILGCTWILGFFHFQEDTAVMGYLFTIVNSFQGTFIFIILCVLNPKIRDAYSKWITCICQTRKSLFESESANVPLSVTSPTQCCGKSPSNLLRPSTRKGEQHELLQSILFTEAPLSWNLCGNSVTGCVRDFCKELTNSFRTNT
ncbi:adhesion G protein-coupled receptor E3-like isoform X2 [Stegostoma tigrinum]|uniref:adhesion G protein-coupled receptor E3-like isoform X2 n=1 Tax=Stegostoma tigrinum TaxID=3053191 RepID=UPI0028709203|nr:adhesion G protein-coupled receptor E3-like isoform X2 [Stegostoma tigrinum]